MWIAARCGAVHHPKIVKLLLASLNALAMALSMAAAGCGANSQSGSTVPATADGHLSKPQVRHKVNG
jgi:hypothetical protein